MILANLRAQLVATDAELVVELLADGDAGHRNHLRERVEREGLEVLLDDPALPEKLKAVTELGHPSSALFLYVHVRRALLAVDVDDERMSDYLSALLLEFGRSKRAHRIARHDDETYSYLADIIAHIDSQSGRRGFLLRVHLGNFALWMAGLFPEYISARGRRNGAPGLRYYETLGMRGFQLASNHRLAQKYGMADLYGTAAASFSALRVALNRVSDELVFPGRYSADRLMRQVANEFSKRADA